MSATALLGDLARERATAELRRRRAALLRRLEVDQAEVLSLTESEADEMLSQHPSDMAAVLELTEQAVGNRELARRELDRIDDALARVADGTYGICEACGRRIAPERLEALPYSSRCVDCQGRLERGQRLTRGPDR